jgi:hypothetical protein
MDTAILIELAKEFNLKVSKVLVNLPYIHSGYLNIILEDTNGRTETND